MTYEQAIRLLHPDTSAEAMAEIEYKHGFRGKQAAIHKINRACEVACKAMKKQIQEKPIPHIVKVDKIRIGNGYWGKGTTVYKCPNCNQFITRSCKHCNECGQGIDWSE